MKLHHITFQGGKHNEKRKFSEIYSQHFGPYREDEMVLAMVKLLEHLEQEVEAPPQWVCISHWDLVLHHRDYKEYGESMDDEDSITLSLSPWGGIYSISYHLPQSVHPWQSLAGSTDDIKTAGQMVVEVFKKAPELTRLLRE